METIYTGKRARTRLAIMHTAKVLFETKGIKNVTFRDIAEKAGMSRTTIFNYFATINDLMVALVDQEMDDLLNYCDKSDGEGTALIRIMFLRLIEDTAKYPLMTSRLITNSILNGHSVNSIGRVEQRIMKELPDMPEAETKAEIIRLTGLYYGLVNHYLINRLPFDEEEMKKRFLELEALSGGILAEDSAE